MKIIVAAFLLMTALPSDAQMAPDSVPPETTGGHWERTNISFGFSTYSGDQDTAQLMSQVNSTIEFGLLESDAIANIGLSHSEGQHLTNQEELDWAFRRSWKLTNPWFLMLHTWYEHDETAGIDFRGSIGPGFGVHAVDNKTMRVTLEGGIAATSEQQVHDQTYAAIFFNPSIRWQMNKKVTLQHKTNFIWNTRDHQDVRVYTQGDINFSVTQRVGVGVSFTIDFDNVPVAGHHKTDVQTATNLTIALGKQQ